MGKTWKYKKKAVILKFLVLLHFGILPKEIKPFEAQRRKKKGKNISGGRSKTIQPFAKEIKKLERMWN